MKGSAVRKILHPERKAVAQPTLRNCWDQVRLHCTSYWGNLPVDRTTEELL